MASISFGQMVSQRVYSSWEEWKTLYLSRPDVNPQYAEDTDKYFIYFYDGPEVHLCEIWKGVLPYLSQNRQVQNDLDLAEFEGSYKILCNKPNISKIEISAVSSSTVIPNVDVTNPSFYAVFDRIAPGENKYVATLWDGSSTHKIVIQRIRVYNWQVASVTGVLLEQQLERITSRTAGISIPIRSCDTLDSLPSGVVADTNSTSVVANHIVERVFATNDEMALTTNNIATWRVELAGAVIYDRKPGTKGHTLRQNQGMAIKNLTKSIVGSVSYVFEFTSEAL